MAGNVPNRCPQYPPGLTPVGFGSQNVTCAVPCNDCPVNIHLKETCAQVIKPCQPSGQLRGPMPSYNQAVQNISCYTPCETQCEPPSNCNLKPININLKMCKMVPPPQQEKQADPCIQYKERTDEDCWSQCVPPKRPPRCPDGNYAERRESFRPDMNWIPPCYPFDGRTTYKTFYQPNVPQDPTKSYRPEYLIPANLAKMEDESLYKYEYRRFPIVPYQKPPWAKAEEFVPNEGCINGISSYRSAYQGGWGLPATTSKPQQLMDPNRPQLDTLTTYNSMFLPFTRDDYTKKPPLEHYAWTHCAPFRGITTYKADYIPKCGKTRKSMKRDSFTFAENNALTGSTTYKAEYEPFHFDKCCKNNMPTKHYDQLYPRSTCDCEVDCFCNPQNIKEPLVPPSPPCTDPCGDPNACYDNDYKVKIRDQDNEDVPTQITLTPSKKACQMCT